MTPSTTLTDNVGYQWGNYAWNSHIDSSIFFYILFINQRLKDVSYPFLLSSSKDFLLGLLIPSILAFGCPLNPESTSQSTTENKAGWSPYQHYLARRKTPWPVLPSIPGCSCGCSSFPQSSDRMQITVELRGLNSAAAPSTLLATHMCLLFLWLFVLT